MSKTLIGILFILFGLCNGSLANDYVNKHTLGWLAENGWIKVQDRSKFKGGLSEAMGRKTTILFYSSIFIIIGLFILWNRNT